ncbi:hypothetical protein [Streptococcus cuniculi]|uniref:Lipoprotein n=1 Tax=Streptococcus cuniculi TaxID=1432788 RepID=A0A4Y9JBI5_9STRE|nr:hypothetical protein [Streptococcus cuniculi]MBF0777911.1 hypothetical protein [Streptococcus cuniculi]TFU98207.1 hypothetical protein E4T82_04155 [Streptococcus cuniculi]
MSIKLLSLLSLVVILTSCGVSPVKKEQIKAEYSPIIVQKFQALGYKGKVSVDNYSKMLETGSERLIFTYSEEVEGEVIIMEASISIDTNQSPEEDLADVEVDMNIKEEAMWQQPAVREQVVQIKQVFSGLETKDLKLVSVAGQSVEAISSSDRELVWEDVVGSKAELSQEAANNRESGLPIGGYYSIDVQKYLKKHALEIRIDFDWQLSKEEQEDVNTPRLDFVRRVEKLDFTHVWDGYYIVGFDRVSRTSRNGDIQDMIVLDIQDGKLVRSFSAL